MQPTRTKAERTRRWRRNASSTFTAIRFLAPALLVMGVVILFPIINAARLSFFNYELTKPKEIAFNLFNNYAYMVRDKIFWQAMKNTGVFTFFTVAIGLVLGLILALVVYELPRRLHGLRGVLLVPWVIPGIVIGYLFMYMFDVEIGVVNYVFQQIGFIREFLPWLMRDDLAMIAIIITHVWNQTPFYMLMITAGLMAIPDEAREASYLEGSSRLQEFRFITFPYLQQIIVIASLLMVIRNFNFFPIIFTMTGGGPAYATTTAVLYIYRLAFERFDIGYASAVGTLWVVILIIVSALYIRTLKERF
jgi:multiple sugar transport system permease protein